MTGLPNRVLACGRRLQPHLPAPVVRVLGSIVGWFRSWRRRRGGLRRQVQRVAGRDHGTVTVVVTAFNDERFLDDCLDSVRRQSYADWRIVVVDDASTDATAAVAARHARDDDRIEVVRHGVNAGLSAARNSGLLRATSPWVCFLDGDDFLLEASLADRVAVLAAANDRDDVAGSFAGWITVAEDARLAEFPARVDGDVSDFEDLLTTAGACPFPAHAPLLRTEVLLAAGGFDETMRVGAEDWDAWLRLMRSGYQFIGSGSRTVAYRMKRASMVGRDPAGHLEVGKGLLDSVHRPAVPASLIPGGPAALDVTLSELIRSVEHARRTLSFAPLIAVGDPERAEATVREVAPRSWRLLERRDDLAARIVTAARRAEQTHPAGADADQLIADVTRWVDEGRSGGSVIDSDALDVAVPRSRRTQPKSTRLPVPPSRRCGWCSTATRVRTGSVMRSLRVVFQRRRCPPYRSVAAGLDRTKSSSARGRPLLRPDWPQIPTHGGPMWPERRLRRLRSTQSIDATAKPLRAFGIGMLANEQSSSATVRRFARPTSPCLRMR